MGIPGVVAVMGAGMIVPRSALQIPPVGFEHVVDDFLVHPFLVEVDHVLGVHNVDRTARVDLANDVLRRYPFLGHRDDFRLRERVNTDVMTMAAAHHKQTPNAQEEFHGVSPIHRKLTAESRTPARGDDPLRWHTESCKSKQSLLLYQHTRFLASSIEPRRQGLTLVLDHSMPGDFHLTARSERVEKSARRSRLCGIMITKSEESRAEDNVP